MIHTVSDGFLPGSINFQSAGDADNTGYYAAELYRQGELFLAQARNGQRRFEAEASFQQALDVARLWQQQDRRAAARALLAPIYEWFTEGFETADLQKPRAFLES